MIPAPPCGPGASRGEEGTFGQRLSAPLPLLSNVIGRSLPTNPSPCPHPRTIAAPAENPLAENPLAHPTPTDRVAPAIRSVAHLPVPARTPVCQFGYASTT